MSDRQASVAAVTKHSALPPVVLLAGLSQSGKTSLLTNLLTALQPTKKRVAVLCSSAADCSTFDPLCDSVVSLSSSSCCTCCSGREEVIKRVRTFCSEENSYDVIIIECSKAAGLLQMAETFMFDSAGKMMDHINADGFLLGGGLGETARVDTSVACVDCATFLEHVNSVDTLNEVDIGTDDWDDRDLSEFLLDSIELATCVVLNKTDAVSVADLARIRLLVTLVNPHARIVECVHGGTIDLLSVLPVPALRGEEFVFSKHIRKPVWMVEALARERAGEEETEHAMVYRGSRPLHASRFATLIDELFVWDLADGETQGPTLDPLVEENEDEDSELEEDSDDDREDKNKDTNEDKEEQDEKEDKEEKDEDEGVDAAKLLEKRKKKFSEVLRMKGILWITDTPQQHVEITASGSMMRLTPSQPWYWDFAEQDWDEAAKDFSPDDVAEARRQVTLNGIWGDRRQEIVIIGDNLEKDKIKAMLDSCLLTDEEMTLPHRKWPSFGRVRDFLADEDEDEDEDEEKPPRGCCCPHDHGHGNHEHNYDDHDDDSCCARGG